MPKTTNRNSSRFERQFLQFAGLALLFAPTLVAQSSPDPVSKTIESRTPVPVVIWHETVDVPQLNLIYGAGGKEDAPRRVQNINSARKTKAAQTRNSTSRTMPAFTGA